MNVLLLTFHLSSNQLVYSGEREKSNSVKKKKLIYSYDYKNDCNFME